MSRWRWFLLIFLVVVVLAVKFLPWYILVGIVVAFVLGLPFLGKWLLGRLFLMPFKAKGAVLHKAAVAVHALEPTVAPPPQTVREALSYETDDEEGDASENEPAKVTLPRNWYRLEVTVTPRPKVGGFQHWEPGELRLIRPQTRVTDATEDDVCTIEDIEIEENGAYQKDEGFKVQGEQRLRLLLGVQPGIDRLVFQYYFEKFGEVQVPER